MTLWYKDIARKSVTQDIYLVLSTNAFKLAYKITQEPLAFSGQWSSFLTANQDVTNYSNTHTFIRPGPARQNTGGIMQNMVKENTHNNHQDRNSAPKLKQLWLVRHVHTCSAISDPSASVCTCALCEGDVSDKVTLLPFRQSCSRLL